MRLISSKSIEDTTLFKKKRKRKEEKDLYQSQSPFWEVISFLYLNNSKLVLIKQLDKSMMTKEKYRLRESSKSNVSQSKHLSTPITTKWTVPSLNSSKLLNRAVISNTEWLRDIWWKYCRSWLTNSTVRDWKGREASSDILLDVM